MTDSEPVPDFNFIENELNNLSPEIVKNGIRNALRKTF